MKNINILIKKLVLYGINKDLIKKSDEIYVTNKFAEYFNLSEIDIIEEEIEVDEELHFILNDLIDYAIKNDLISDTAVSKDLFDTAVMSILIDRPSNVIASFWDKYKITPKNATDYYYNLSINSNYIRKDRIEKDVKWKVSTEFSTLDITINLSKPEKDPKDIALLKNAPASNYPKCLLCKENEGYSGTISKPARQNHRIIPVKLNNEDWFIQYSPYVYYNEHLIIFNGEHIPMVINESTFVKLLDFVDIFPHYIIGSNADLPIVGGSILSHEHFQGGNYVFAMENAEVLHTFYSDTYKDVSINILKWPMSVIRLCGKDKTSIIELSNHILSKWKNYSDEEVSIFAKTNDTLHNTITPIVRFKNNMYEMDLVLRNNYTTKEYPDGLFHPHKNLHHIKKENIGLIEVMGLAVLPSRLLSEMEALKSAILNNEDMLHNELTEKHANWATSFIKNYNNISEDNIDEILKDEIGKVFLEVLKDAGVFKCNDTGINAFVKFVKSIIE